MRRRWVRWWGWFIWMLYTHCAVPLIFHPPTQEAITVEFAGSRSNVYQYRWRILKTNCAGDTLRYEERTYTDRRTHLGTGVWFPVGASSDGSITFGGIFFRGDILETWERSSEPDIRVNSTFFLMMGSRLPIIRKADPELPYEFGFTLRGGLMLPPLPSSLPDHVDPHVFFGTDPYVISILPYFAIRDRFSISFGVFPPSLIVQVTPTAGFSFYGGISHPWVTREETQGAYTVWYTLFPYFIHVGVQGILSEP